MRPVYLSQGGGGGFGEKKPIASPVASEVKRGGMGPSSPPIALPGAVVFPALEDTFSNGNQNFADCTKEIKRTERQEFSQSSTCEHTWN